MPEPVSQSGDALLRGSVLVLLQFERLRGHSSGQASGACQRPQGRPAQHEAPRAGIRRATKGRQSLCPPNRWCWRAVSACKARSSTTTTALLSVVFELPFAGDWDKLIGLASRWVWDIDFAAQATAIVRASLAARGARADQALRRVAERRLSDFSCSRNYRLALCHRPDSPARPAHRAGGSRRHRPTGRERVQRGAAIAHLLLRQRPGGHRLERGVSL